LRLRGEQQRALRRRRSGRRTGLAGPLVAEERRQQRLEPGERALGLRGLGRLLGDAPRRAAAPGWPEPAPGRVATLSRDADMRTRSLLVLGGWLTRSASDLREGV